jgi:hypothetical protein
LPAEWNYWKEQAITGISWPGFGPNIAEIKLVAAYAAVPQPQT